MATFLSNSTFREFSDHQTGQSNETEYWSFSVDKRKLLLGFKQEGDFQNKSDHSPANKPIRLICNLFLSYVRLNLITSFKDIQAERNTCKIYGNLSE